MITKKEFLDRIKGIERMKPYKKRAYENISYTVYPFTEDYKSGDMVLENQSFTFMPHHKYKRARKMIVACSIISAITSAAITYFLIR